MSSNLLSFPGQQVNPVKELLDTYRSNLLDFDQLQSVPDPTWLVDGYLMADSVAVLWGDPSAGKSFVAVDWAMSIATDTRWFGKTTRKGNVLYVAGEGVSGLKKRMNAWSYYHQVRPYGEELLLLKRPLRLLDPHVAEVAEQLALEQQASLVILDTLARSIVGHSENDSTDMGRLVDIAEQVRERTQATVLFVHHSNKSATRTMRGSTALKGAVDTEIELVVEEESEQRTLHCRKQKDAAPFKAQPFTLRRIGESLVPEPQTGEF